jgi:hypothetical protein
MTRYHRELHRVLAEAGLTDVTIRHTRKHLKIICTEGLLTVAATPGDRRNLLNIRAAARRLADCAF